jgi:hypothetical protein
MNYYFYSLINDAAGAITNVALWQIVQQEER